MISTTGHYQNAPNVPFSQHDMKLIIVYRKIQKQGLAFHVNITVLIV